MKCKEAKILVSAAVDGELTPSEEVALEQHVLSCTGCAKDKIEFVRLSEAMPLWADEEPSPWLTEKFAYKLALLQESRTACLPQKRFRWGTLSAATAGLVAAVLAIGLLIHSNVPQAPMQAKIQPPTKVVQPTQPTESLVAKGNPVVQPPTNPVRHPVGGQRHSVRHIAVGHPKSPQPEANLGVAPPAPAPEPLGWSNRAISTGAVALVTKSEVSENLGEASLAMNETIERVRGNLQKSVDLMVSQPPVPATDSTHSNGGIQ